MENQTNIREIRARLGWSQYKMAEFLGVDRSSVSHMECGREVSGPVAKLLQTLAPRVKRAEARAAKGSKS